MNLKGMKRYVSEEVTNSVGGGAIAGVGVGPDGEPGLTPSQQARHKSKNVAKSKIRKKLRDVINDRRKDVRATDPDQ